VTQGKRIHAFRDCNLAAALDPSYALALQVRSGLLAQFAYYKAAAQVMIQITMPLPTCWCMHKVLT